MTDIIVVLNDHELPMNKTLLCIISEFVTNWVNGTGKNYKKLFREVNGEKLQVLEIKTDEESVNIGSLKILLDTYFLNANEKLTLKEVIGAIHLGHYLSYRDIKKIYRRLFDVLSGVFVYNYQMQDYEELCQLLKYEILKPYHIQIWVNNIKNSKIQHDLSLDSTDIIHQRALLMGIKPSDSRLLDEDGGWSCLKEEMYLNRHTSSITLFGFDVKRTSDVLAIGSIHKNRRLYKGIQMSRHAIKINANVHKSYRFLELCVYLGGYNFEYERTKLSSTLRSEIPVLIFNKGMCWSQGEIGDVQFSLEYKPNNTSCVLNFNLDTPSSHIYELRAMLTTGSTNYSYSKVDYCRTHPIYPICVKKPILLFDEDVPYNSWIETPEGTHYMGVYGMELSGKKRKIVEEREDEYSEYSEDVSESEVAE